MYFVYENDVVKNKLPCECDRLKTLSDANAVSTRKNCPLILISTEPCQFDTADRMGWRQQSASDSHSHHGAVVDKRVWAGPKRIRGFRWYNSIPSSTSHSILSLTSSSRYLLPCFRLVEKVGGGLSRSVREVQNQTGNPTGIHGTP